MRRTICSLLLIVLTAMLAGCPKIPRNGALLAGKVSEGIERIQRENEKIITALADVERAILDKEWESLYATVEKKYMEKHSIENESDLTQVDRRKIAANAAAVRGTILTDISEIERELISKTRENANTVIEMNEEVRKYLLSLEKLDEATENVSAKLGEIIDIDLSQLTGFTRKKLTHKGEE